MAPQPMDPVGIANIVSTLGAPEGTTVAEWVAKSRQESSHRPWVVNRGNGNRHVGLFQISEIHAGIDGTTRNRELFVAYLMKPDNNYQVAKALYERDGWRPWNASGGKPTPNASDIAAADAGKVTWSDPVTDIVGDPLEGLVDTVQKAYEWIANRKNLGRIALGGIGFVVIAGAAITLAKPSVEGLIPK